MHLFMLVGVVLVAAVVMKPQFWRLRVTTLLDTEPGRAPDPSTLGSGCGIVTGLGRIRWNEGTLWL